MTRPVIGLSCCMRTISVPQVGETRHHTVYEMYVRYVFDILGAIPVLVPAVFSSERQSDLSELVTRFDGIVLTGSPSNISLRSVDGSLREIDSVGTRDLARDQTTLPLVRAALIESVPLLGICRGMQELNVALGGELHQEIHAMPDRRDHRSRKDVPAKERYGPAHPVEVLPTSRLADWLAESNAEGLSFMTNSLHVQGVSRLGEGVVAQAIADDGTVEAVHVPGAPAFAFGVQWHPEWHHDTCTLSQAVTGAFREAVSRRCQARQ